MKTIIADDRGGVTDAVIHKISRIAKGKAALITSGHMVVHPWGRSNKGQLGIEMERAVTNGQTDLVALCRPLIREPLLVKQIEQGKSKAASCINCNRCFIALAYGLPGRCYSKGLRAQAFAEKTHRSPR